MSARISSPAVRPTREATSLAGRYATVRRRTTALAAPLRAEDTVPQSMPEASPAKWHLAHTSWFFERFLLVEHMPGYQPFHPGFDFLFNSYYQSVGTMHARPERGLLSRPSLEQVLAYRAHVDEAMVAWLESAESEHFADRLVLGLHHEQQHQELLLTDIKHLFSCNPLQPAYHAAPPQPEHAEVPLAFVAGIPGIHEIGAGENGFAYDNERPRHRVLLSEHALASRLVTNAEYRAFIDDGGYGTASLWLADGWDRVQADDWTRPLYWSEELESEFTLGGRCALDPQAPVCHLSYFEADAFARWAEARLPTEAEWEVAAAAVAHGSGNLQDSGLLHPQRPDAEPSAHHRQLFGDVWEWTASAYAAYPGFRPLGGSLGEYNGKFMCGQYVLRGGSCVTAADHIRASYRNFFYPKDRWQFSGLRLARDTA